jgi:hypothetical protein
LNKRNVGQAHDTGITGHASGKERDGRDEFGPERFALRPLLMN